MPFTSRGPAVAAAVTLIQLASAQTTHPAIAPPQANQTAQALGLVPTPLCNEANSTWDNGEGFQSPADSGGVLLPGTQGFADGTALTLADVAWDPGGWNVHLVDPVAERTGTFRGDPTSGFLVTAPITFDSNRQTVFVLTTPPTLGATDLHRLGPGQIAEHWIHRPHDLIDYASTSLNVNLVIASPALPLAGRPATFAVQRALQLERAVRLLLDQSTVFPVPGPDTARPTGIHGGSFGGQTVQALLLAFPDRFHAGFASGFPASMRSLLDEQEALSFSSAMTSSVGHGNGWNRRDSLEFNMLADRLGMDYSGLDTVQRFHLDQLQRPLYLMFGDEDVVASGLEAIGALAGVSSTVTPLFGTVQKSANSPPLMWSVARASGHGFAPTPRKHRLANGTVVASTTEPDFEAIKQVWLPELIAEAGRNRMIQTDHPKTLGTPNNPHEHVLRRYRGTQRSSNVDIARASGFSSFGLGARLGEEETLCSVGDWIYVGSSDGFVSKVQRTGSGPGTVWLATAQSAELGYGIRGLDIADVDGSGSLEIVATTYDRVFILNASDLTELGQLELSEGAGFGWDYRQPRRLHCADMDGDNDAEIVFVTENGQLAGLDIDSEFNMTKLFSYREPGIVDFELGPPINNMGSGLGSVYIASSRGYIAELAIDLGGATLARVSDLSQSEHHRMIMTDLECDSMDRLFAGDGTGRLTRYPKVDLVPDASIDLAHAILDIAVFPGIDNEEWLAVLIADQSETMATSASCRIVILDLNLNVLLDRAIHEFPPAMGALSLIASRTLYPDSNYQIAVATAHGKLVVFDEPDIDSSSNLGSIPRPTGLENTAVSFASTWAMIVDNGQLVAVDQTGGKFEIDPLSGLPVPGKFEQLEYFLPDQGPVRSVRYIARIPGISWATSSTISPPSTPPAGPQTALVDIVSGGWSRIDRTSDFVFTRQAGLFIPGPTDQRMLLVSNGPSANSVVSMSWNAVTGDITGSASSRANGLPLRSDRFRFAPYDTQALQIGHFGPSDYVVMGTGGGRVLLLEENLGSIVQRSEDYGTGGMALDVATGLLQQAGGPAEDAIVFGTCYGPPNAPNAPAIASLYLLGYGSGVTQLGDAALDEIHRIDFTMDTSPEIPGALPGEARSLGYGICGVCVAEVLESNPGLEVVVGTLNGELRVYGLSAAGFTPTPLWKGLYPGSIGAFNSIIVDDLVPDPQGKPEIYVAGSMGIQRFDVQ